MLVGTRDGTRRAVRISEAVWLGRPDLWTRDGLEEYLCEHGIDPSRPYRLVDNGEPDVWLFEQDGVAREAPAAPVTPIAA